jgi:hypothetical protein
MTQLEEKDRQIQQLIVARETPPANAEPTRDELIAAYAESAGDPAVQAQIAEKLVDIKVAEKSVAMRAEQTFINKQQAYNTKTMAKYPEITDPTSEFYMAVARNLQARVQEGHPNSPSAILDAANDVASEHPELLGRAQTRISPRGFGESGGGKPVTTPKPKEAEVDPVLFAKYKREYPGITQESIAKRQAEIDARSLWHKES